MGVMAQVKKVKKTNNNATKEDENFLDIILPIISYFFIFIPQLFF